MEKLKEINWNQLYYFYEVAKASSLKEASKSLGVTSSTLSEHLKKLESKFQKVFFVRSSKGLELNNDGLKLFEQVRPIFEQGSRLLDHYSNDIIGGYPINVGIEETISTALACEFTSQYWDLYTKFGTVNTTRQPAHESLIENLIQGKIDWGISVREPRRKSLNFKEIGSFEIIFACSAELYKKFIDKKDLLINIPFAKNSWDKNINKAILQYLRDHSAVPRETIFSDHPLLVRDLCERGRCVMFMPKNPLDDYEGLKTFQFDNPLSIKIFAIWKKSDEELISIIKLKELISSKISQLPTRYEDIDLQIEASDIDDDLLNK